jgi:hypothetical protein
MHQNIRQPDIKHHWFRRYGAHKHQIVQKQVYERSLTEEANVKEKGAEHKRLQQYLSHEDAGDNNLRRIYQIKRRAYPRPLSRNVHILQQHQYQKRVDKYKQHLKTNDQIVVVVKIDEKCDQRRIQEQSSAEKIRIDWFRQVAAINDMVVDQILSAANILGCVSGNRDLAVLINMPKNDTINYNRTDE